jgi:hypothetical protein
MVKRTVNAKPTKHLTHCDSVLLDQTYWTEEGYLVDHPVVTRVGIFEYTNPDGSIRREFRPPEEVFDPESLASYKGKPVIVTHDAGEVNKDNVSDESIGTMLSEGYRDGNNVRVETIIQDTNTLKRYKYRELSLGYSLDLDETPGEWNGQSYDAVQRNIRINHLAIVGNARAGDNARLNIDQKDKTPKGDPKMAKTQTKATTKATTKKKRRDCLTPEELELAIAEFKAKKGTGTPEGTEAPQPVTDEDEDPTNPLAVAEGQEEQEDEEEHLDAEEVLGEVKANQDRRDEEGAPADLESATAQIAEMAADIEKLVDVVETQSASADVAATTADEDDTNTDADEENADEDEEPAKTMNADSVDRLVSEKLRLGRIGDKFHLDGLESLSPIAAKKRIIAKLNPKLHLDGKSKIYINAAFDAVIASNNGRKGTDYQRQQMFNRDSASHAPRSGALSARDRMIQRMEGED